MAAARLSRASLRDGLLIAAVVLIAHAPVLSGWLDADPLGPRSGLVTTVVPGPLRGSDTLDPNDGVISQALGHRAALDLLHLSPPWWDPFAATGQPLAGEAQSAALFPPTLLTALSGGQLYEHMLLELIAGLATWALLLRLEVRRSVAVGAGGAFALCGTFAWFGHAPVNPIACLPLVALGIEHASADAATGRPGGWGLLALAGALSLYAGFPEVAYIDALLGAAWAIWRVAALPRARRTALLGKLLTGALAAALLAAPALVPTLDFFTRATIPLHSTGYFGSVHLPASGLPQLLLPYVYGPLFAFSDPSWGNIGGYLTTSLLPFALIGVADCRRRGLAIALVTWLGLALARTYGVPGLGAVLGLLPGMSSVAFSRYVFAALALPVIVLAAVGLEAVLAGRVARSRLLSAGAGALALVAAAAIGARPLAARLGAAYTGSPDYWLAVGWGAVLCLAPVALATFAIGRSAPGGGRWLAGAVVALLVLDALVLFGVPELAAPRSVRVDTAPVRFLARHLGAARFVTLGPLQPNYGAYFGLAELNISDGAISSNFAGEVGRRLNPFVAPTLLVGRRGAVALLYSVPTVAEVLHQLAGYRQAAVRYVLVPRGAPPVPAGPLRLAAVTASTRIYMLGGAAPYLSAPGCRVLGASRTEVSLSCRRASTLIRRETAMPGWSAQVDGRRVAVRRDGLYQAVPVPSGRHRVRFGFAPPGLPLALAACLLGWVWVLGAAFSRRPRTRARRWTAGRRRSAGG